MGNKPVIEGLKRNLADSYALLLKTQNYHWNVTGPNFKSLHLTFEEQYNDLFMAVDAIAERIRTLGEKAPGTWKAYEAISSIKDGNEDADATTMVKDLVADQASIAKGLQETLEAAQSANDEATVDLMVGRIAIHEKAGWMLRSSI